MSDKDINIHIRAKNADAAKQKLDGVSESTKKIGDSARQGASGVGKLGESSRKTTGLVGGLLDRLAGFFSITAVIAAVTSAIRVQGQAIEENAQKAQDYQNKLLRLQFLGEMFKERPELRSEVADLAEFGRRDFAEVSDAWYNLRSKGGSMSAKQKDSIMREALEMGRTDPSMPLGTLVDMFSLYAKQTGQGDANRIQNVLQQTITEAGGSGADVARYMPQFLPIGISGGLSGSQSAGLWSYVTTQLADASIATTGLRATFMGLQGRGTPEAAKLLEGFGVTGDMNFMQKINTLSGAYHGGDLDLAAAEQIGGREGAAVLLSMLKNPQAMTRTIGSVVGSDRGDIDLTGSRIKDLFGSDEFARTEEDVRLLDIAIDNTRATDQNALKADKIRKISELEARKRGDPEAKIGLESWLQKKLVSIGVSPEVSYAATRNIGKKYIQAINPLFGPLKGYSDITRDIMKDIPAYDTVDACVKSIDS